MARTTINTQVIPDGTIVSADLSYPLTNFSSTGIDDNAVSTALTIDSSGNISVTGTVDGRDLATDGTKLDGIATSATNYGDSDVATYISGNRSYGNITTTGYIAGPSTFTIDPAAVGDNTGTLVIAGNLQVDGTTTTINSTTMTVDDLNITLASGAANAAAANGAGITVDGANATLTYNGTNDAWHINKNLGLNYNNPQNNIHILGTSTTPNVGITLQSHDTANATATLSLLARDASNVNQSVNIQNTAGNLYINSNVGIGTTSPSNILHLKSATPVPILETTSDLDTSAGAYISYRDPGGERAWVGFGTGDAVFSVASNVNNSMQFRTFGSVKMILNSSGELKLHDGNGTDDNALRFSYGGSSGLATIAARSTGGSTNIAFSVSNSGTLSEAMRIDDAGYVGFANINPAARLDIQTPSYATSTTDGMIKFNDSVNGQHTAIQSYHVGGQGSDIHIGTNSYINTSGSFSRWSASYAGAIASFYRQGIIAFNTNTSSGVVVERMRVNADGQVLIGQTTSTSSGTASKFQVTGNIDLNGSTPGGNNVLRLYGNGTERGQLYAHAAGVTLYAHSGSETNLYSNGALTMQISDGNKVQINATNTPTYTLEVAGTNDINFRIMRNFQDNGIIRIGRSDGTDRWHDIVAYNDTTQNANYIAFDVHNGTASSTYRAARIQGDGTIKAGGGLQAQLQRAYTNVGLINNNRMPVGHYAPGETVFEIDPTWSSQQLQDYFNLTSAQCDWVEDSTAPGGYAIKITGNRSVGGNYASGFPYIPVDQDDKFYMECWIKNTGGGVTGHYMGSIDYSHTFASLGGNPGSFGYWVMSNYTTDSSSGWIKVSGYITGFGTSVGQFVSGTKYWTPQALFNYTLSSGTRECYISGWKVIKVRIPGDRRYSGHQFIETSASVGTGNGQSLYSGGDGIGLHGDNSYATCGTHIELSTNAARGWANIYLNRTFAIPPSDYRFFDFRVNGTTVGTITHSGTSSTNYNTTSDYRLKENIVTLENATERLKQIPVRRFNFISDPDTTVDGFVAHEVSDYVPEAIIGTKDETRTEEYIITEGVEEVRDEEGNVVVEGVEEVKGTREVPVYQGIDQSKLVPLMLATIKELEARITQLEEGARNASEAT